MGLKPSEMLRKLRTDAPMHIPTIRQLNNYLKELRKGLEGELGTKICLNDFVKIHEENRAIPDDPDQMFVGACYTYSSEKNIDPVTKKLVQKARIFLKTKRLMSFTNDVSFKSFILNWFITA